MLVGDPGERETLLDRGIRSQPLIWRKDPGGPPFCVVGWPLVMTDFLGERESGDGMGIYRREKKEGGGLKIYSGFQGMFE